MNKLKIVKTLALALAGWMMCGSLALHAEGVQIPANLYHYDFEGGYANTKGSAAAVDSSYLFGSLGSGTDVKFTSARAGQAVLLNNKYRPDFSSLPKTIFHNGAATITAIIRPVTGAKSIVWVYGAGDRNPSVALVVEDESTLALAMRHDPNGGANSTSGAITVIASVGGIENLTTEEHFVVATFDGNGATLRVDDYPVVTSEAVTAPMLAAFTACGSFGRYNWAGSMGNYQAQNADGCWLNDWRAYDLALTTDQQNAIRYEFFPEENATVLNASGETAFDVAENWKANAVPDGGEISIMLSGTAVVSVAAPARTYSKIKLFGTGSVRFVGEGVLMTDELVVRGGVDCWCAGIDATHVTVENGGSVDIANVGADSAYTFTIAGNGVGGKGAIYDSSTNDAVTNTIAELTLSRNATITADHPWGVKPSAGSETALLSLGTWTLTKTGDADFALDDVVSSTNGSIVAESGSLTMGWLVASNTLNVAVGSNTSFTYGNTFVHDGTDNQKNLTRRIKITVEDGATVILDGVSLEYANSPKWTFRPDVVNPITIAGTGSFASDMNYQGEFKMSGGLIDQAALTIGQEILLLTNKMEKAFKMSVNNACGGRFKTEVKAWSVTATVQKPTNIYHYDFDNGTLYLRGSAIASDSTYIQGYYPWTESGNVGKWPSDRVGSSLELVEARGGKAIVVNGNSSDAERKFYAAFGSSTFNKSVFHAGVVTVVAVFQPIATDKRYIWSYGQTDNKTPAIALVIEGDELAVIATPNGQVATCEKLVSLSGISDLTTKEHFVVVKLTGHGTTLIVDDIGKPVRSPKTYPLAFNSESFEFGGINYAASYLGYNQQPAKGYYLNDFSVYDAELNDDELEAIRRKFWPSGLLIIIR